MVLYKVLLLHWLILGVAGIVKWLPQPPVVPGALGVNIHFSGVPQPGVMPMLAASGVKWIRMDFKWDATEHEKSVYDFTAYDELTTSLQEHGLGALYILDYSNPLYDGGLSPHTNEGRTAFAAWASAAAEHFKDKKIVWEMYNEPNIGFWKPSPNVTAYSLLALAVGEALEKHLPDAAYVGPGSSGVDMNFIEACFKAGLLKYWDAVSVHPYRLTTPETAASDITNLRELIKKYAPPSRGDIPIISSEWGYSTMYRGFDVERQSKVLVRSWLNNLMNNVVLSIWYDWVNDGTNQSYTEDHFGMVYEAYHKGQTPVYDPKPAYRAAQMLTTILNETTYTGELDTGDSELFAKVFTHTKTGKETLVVWCNNTQRLPCPVRVSVGEKKVCYTQTDYVGQVLPQFCSDEQGKLFVAADNAPLYLQVATSNTKQNNARLKGGHDEHEEEKDITNHLFTKHIHK